MDRGKLKWIVVKMRTQSMPKIQNQIRLSDAEVHLLEELVSKGSAKARVIRRGQSLLLAHQNQQDQDIARFLQVTQIR